MYTIKMLRLTKEESKMVNKTGLRFAVINMSRWEEMPVENLLDTYDVGTTYVVVGDTAYTIFKDYIFIDKKIRLFILKDRNIESDRIESETVSND